MKSNVILSTLIHDVNAYYSTISTEIDTYRQRKLQLRWETLIGYESQKCTHAYRVAYWGGL
jgi:hypothetical protein